MTAVKPEQAPHGQKLQGKQGYYDTLRTLSQASVDQHFEAFKDIAWDDPALEVHPGDERFILTDADEIGASDWYKSLPRARQIEVGAYRYAQIAKVGRQFEQVLIGGVMHHLIQAEDGNPEFRYAMHEVTEETHHIQMFQESVNRFVANAGLGSVAGAPRWFTRTAPLVTSAGTWFPELFFVGILAGEEPIDHLQKSIMRAGGSHPLIDRVMQIHIAEEARHIGFAHQYLEHHWAQLGPVKRRVLAYLFPVVMRALCDVIMVPSKQARRDMGIPDEVAEQIWWDAEESAKLLRDLFGDVRLLADNLGIRRGGARLLWKMLKIDGRPSRHRSEVASAAS
ncbi:diiron oxygenase [Nocardioides sp. BP30]|uniref:AurF N-oxygenase family protein n=1 Tax=Nocardioides sp. BP30 TaxID=3036374 RepID=UPI0024699012|nr:diiron oxygenase [Nocardioides sp. BP30]WGL50395.1 diiron oxygenase [Nocardioides sp. BP30]